MNLSELEPGVELVLANDDGQSVAVVYVTHNHIRMQVEDPRGFNHDVAWNDPHLWVADPATLRAFTYTGEEPVAPPPELE